MANPTSNFGWQMPTPVDLVTDLPADFEVFGQAVDSSLADLKGGTSGQVLAKNSNTDMDFVWVTNAGYRLQETIYYTTSGSFVKASYPNVKAIRVVCVGAGGGGGGAATTGASQVAAGVPGGGGATSQSFITNIAGLSASETVTVGAGGAGGAAGNNVGTTGGDSSFGALVVAKGGIYGGGGQANSVPTNGQTASLGGSASAGTGDLKISGNPSDGGIQVNASFPSRPASGWSEYGARTRSDIVGSGAAGDTGNLYGGGGSGGINSQNQATARAGGAGGAGLVIVEVWS